MSHRSKLLLALACTGFLGALAWGVGIWRGPSRAPARSPLRPGLEGRWKTETEWLVDFIVRDVAGMATLAAVGRAPGPSDLTLRVSQSASTQGAAVIVHVSASLITVPGKPPRTVEEDLRLEPHLFAAEPYQGIARALLGAAGAPSAPAATETAGSRRLLEALLDLRASTLLRENRLLSERLKANPRDPAAHEDAALLAAAYSMREGSGWFWDNRLAIARVTGHLAASRALRSEPGLSGRYAQAILSAQVDRQADSMEQLAVLERAAGGAPEELAWIRTLRVRNTMDWRLTTGEKSLSLAEKHEEFCAIVRALRDPGTAVEVLDRRGADDVPDWGRMLLAVGASVEIGNRFAPMQLPLETQELHEAWTSLRGDPVPEESAWIVALNEEPAGAVSRDAEGQTVVSVLGWGAWAAAGQRHLLHAVQKYNYFLAHMLSLPEDAKSFARSSRDLWGGLTLYPLVLLAGAEDAASYFAATKPVIELARRHPERLGGGCWWLMRLKPDFEVAAPALPDENDWFRPSMIPGTLYELGLRVRLRDAVTSAADERRRMIAMAPYTYELVKLDLDQTRDPLPTLSQRVAALGSMADFNSRAMEDLADAAWGDPPEFERFQGRLCRLVPEHCFKLGRRLADLGQMEKARAAYQDGWDRARDRVAASNASLWLVDYYFDHGQKKKALRIAREAAQVYSSWGLFSMARLMERMGRLEDAELHYGRILQRYDKKRELLGFFYRQARVAKNPAYERRLEKMLPEVFPKGLEPLDRDRLPARPSDGVAIEEDNDRMLTQGLKRGDVIVGLDGFRVHDVEQYMAVRSLSQASGMRFVVWRSASYDDVTATFWNRRFDARLKDHKPAAK